MRTMTQNEFIFPEPVAETVRAPALRRPRICLGAAALAGAGFMSTAVIMLLTAWAAQRGGANLLGALSWMSGLMLLALAVDGSGWRGLGHCLGGALLLVLAWLASRVAPEFALLSALVIGLTVSDALWQLRPSVRRFEPEVLEVQDVLAGGDGAQVP